eukprot:NODE_7147_length_462_cov_30.262687_g6981_i0.p1 GENE.NODE_7147_length_462_cov_30.262687_g6981_i0~~NODE_7147_length_462_cov_30.262687_g6981_i0.p1  ORF type:complete len:153 (-),score=63.50 NODE_7147_length_462_cov_30.262687_g6981_i0:3-395(-)
MKQGSPYVMILCSSAIRCCEVLRELRQLQDTNSNPVLKLFAKHMKVPQQAYQLQKAWVCVVVGTAQRMGELCEEGSLKLDALKFVVVDMWRNQKDMNLLEIKPGNLQFCEFFHKHLHPRVVAQHTNVLMF